MQRWILALVTAVLLTGTTRAQEKREELVDKVNRAIDDGVKFLRNSQDKDGGWEANDLVSRAYPGGWSALAVLSLLQCGVDVKDEAVQRGLKYLRGVEPSKTYVVGLQTMVFCLAEPEKYRELIQRNVDWLQKAKLTNGWTYNISTTRPDTSNSQYALLGLHEAHRAGFKIDPKVFEEVRRYYVDTIGLTTDKKAGGWRYPDSNNNSITMTTAGLCNLLIAGMDLAQSEAKLRDDGSAENCGTYKDNLTITQATNWLAATFPAKIDRDAMQARDVIKRFSHPFYSLYGIERAGRLTGQRFMGEHDWYRVGCEWLVETQVRNDAKSPKMNGSWHGDDGFDRWPVVSTSFALLFLSKGRNPVLISKLAWGDKNSMGWNNKRNDMRNLVEYVSKELFELKQPLAWQVFDIRHFATKAGLIEQLTPELLQAPIVYLNGHTLTLSDNEIELLKEYVSNGGFIVAEACCGDERFDRAFRDAMDKVVPNSDLKPLKADHPIWTASGKFKIPPGKVPLEGIEKGCKTVVVYSPKPLAGYWEINDQKSEHGKMSFQVMANIVAYATGMEPPKFKGTKADFLSGKTEPKTAPRGYLEVAQLRHDGDWQPAPRAMRVLMNEISLLDIEVSEKTQPISLTDKDLRKYKFFYMHGRKKFTQPDDKSIEDLRFTLKTGGTLFADAACGDKQFDDSFRELMKQLFPNEKFDPIAVIPNQAAHELYSKEINGDVISKVKCRIEERGKPSEKYLEVEPYLEGIKIKGRWVVIYSKYDIGCALEKNKSSNCIGYEYESAKKLARAVVLYSLRR